MKKAALAIVLLMVASLFIAACGAKTELTTVEDEGVETEEEMVVELPTPPPAPAPVETEPVEIQEEPEPVEEAGMDTVTGSSVVETGGCLDPDVQMLVDKAKSTKEMRYLMRKPPYFRDEYEVFVKDNKMKIVLPEASKFVRGEYFNTIYLDTDSKEAIAYCEDRVRCDDLNKPFEVEYNDYYELTPKDWILTLGCADNIGTETMFNRHTVVVEYKEDSKTNRMNLYSYYGVAAQVIKDIDAKEPKMWSFEMISSSLTKEDVTHQTFD